MHTVILMTDGSVWTCGENLYGALGDGTTTDQHTAEQVIAGGVQAVGAGTYHSVALKTDGSLWAWGDNYTGQLLPERVVASGVQAISVNTDDTLILKTDGSLSGCGANDGYQLGDGTTTNRLTPVPITF